MQYIREQKFSNIEFVKGDTVYNLSLIFVYRKNEYIIPIYQCDEYFDRDEEYGTNIPKAVAKQFLSDGRNVIILNNCTLLQPWWFIKSVILHEVGHIVLRHLGTVEKCNEQEFEANEYVFNNGCNLILMLNYLRDEFGIVVTKRLKHAWVILRKRKRNSFFKKMNRIKHFTHLRRNIHHVDTSRISS